MHLIFFSSSRLSRNCGTHPVVSSDVVAVSGKTLFFSIKNLLEGTSYKISCFWMLYFSGSKTLQPLKLYIILRDTPLI
jgi:hypothetical protein